MKHTPGPWVAQPGFAHFWMVDSVNGPGTVAHGMHKPDADLIAAAPDLYEALSKTLTAFHYAFMECHLPPNWTREDEAMSLLKFDDEPAVVAARAALAKAEGR